MYATCAIAAQLSRRAGRRRSAPRSRRRPRPPHRQQGRPLVHVHDPARHALLAAVEPAGHRADLQAHDRAQLRPAHDGDRPARCSSRDVVGAPAYMAGKARHIAGVEAQRRPADDSPHGARPGPAGPARDHAVLRRPHRHAEPARLRSDPLRRPVLRRLGDTGTELRPAPQSQLPRQPPAPAPADRDHRRRVTPGRPDRGVKARLRDRRRPRRGKRAARTPLRRAQRRRPAAGGSATSSTARSRSTTST